MTSVLITRPHDAAQSFARALEHRGYKVVAEPLLSIVSLDTSPPTAPVDAVMITSSNTFLALGQKSRGLTAFLELPCFCVGARTAEKAHAAGFLHVRHGDGDGADLARIIGSALDKKNAALLHIAGQHADSKARIALEALGHHVRTWPVYDGHPAKEFSRATHDMLKTGKLDAVTLFSPRTAEVFMRLIAHEALEACCARLVAICLSEPVAEVLRPIGWRRLAAAPKPTEENMIACLDEICPVKPT